jgi:UDPglucose 6-dehydrogenase
VFRNPDFTKISDLMKEKVIFDGRNLYDIEKMTSLGYRYYSIGRKVI